MDAKVTILLTEYLRLVRGFDPDKAARSEAAYPELEDHFQGALSAYLLDLAAKRQPKGNA